MPRKAAKSTGPDAGAKFAKSLAGNANGHQLQLEQVCKPEELWALAEECVLVGVPLTIGRVRDGSAVTLAFYAAGDRHTWYLTNHADWEVMISEFES